MSSRYTRARTARVANHTPSPTSMQIANGRGGSAGSSGSSSGRRRRRRGQHGATTPGHHGPGSRAAAEAAAITSPTSSPGVVAMVGGGTSGSSGGSNSSSGAARNAGRQSRRTKHRIPFPGAHCRDGHSKDEATKNSSDILDPTEERSHFLFVIN